MQVLLRWCSADPPEIPNKDWLKLSSHENLPARFQLWWPGKTCVSKGVKIVPNSLYEQLQISFFFSWTFCFDAKWMIGSSLARLPSAPVRSVLSWDRGSPQPLHQRTEPAKPPCPDSCPWYFKMASGDFAYEIKFLTVSSRNTGDSLSQCRLNYYNEAIILLLQVYPSDKQKQ